MLQTSATVAIGLNFLATTVHLNLRSNTDRDKHGHFWSFFTIQSQSIELTTTLHFTLKVLWCSNHLMQKMTHKTSPIYPFESIFQKFCFEILMIFKVLDTATKGPVHLELFCQLGSVAGLVIQANWWLTFEDDLKSGGWPCFTTQGTSVRTGLAKSMVTLVEIGDG